MLKTIRLPKNLKRLNNGLLPQKKYGNFIDLSENGDVEPQIPADDKKFQSVVPKEMISINGIKRLGINRSLDPSGRNSRDEQQSSYVEKNPNGNQQTNIRPRVGRKLIKVSDSKK